MKQHLSTWWYRLPSIIRKPLVVLVGSALIIIAALTGPLPGPGGIPLFLLAIAILATEFEWAKRVRDKVLTWVKQTGNYIKKNPLLGVFFITIVIIIFIGIGYTISRFVKVY